MTEAQKPSSVIREQILRNPDVVLADPELMSALLAAGDGNGGVRNITDLRDKLVDRLEERLDRLESTNRTVIAAAYENLAGTNQIHRAVLALLDATDFRSFLETLGEELPHILSVDAIRLGLETTSVPPGTALGPCGSLADMVAALPAGGVAEYLSEGGDRPPRRISLRRATAKTDELFGQGAAWVQSEAALRLDLGPGRNPGLLVMGSEDPQRFTGDMGTDLLGFFAGSFERLLRRWVT